jgi:hypothetical protein
MLILCFTNQLIVALKLKKLVMISFLSTFLFVGSVLAQPAFREQSTIISFRDSLLFALSEKSEEQSEEFYLPFILLSDRNISQKNMLEAEEKTALLFNNLPKRGKNFKLYMQSVFRYVHGTFLRKYSEYPSFYETLMHGNYDCLTATTLFVLIFKHLDIRHEIVEIKQHIYLLAYDETGRRVLIESTDVRNGCVLFEADIRERLKDYDLKNSRLSDDLLGEKDYKRNITTPQLVGLHFFNQAVSVFNKSNYMLAVDFLKIADRFYPSRRISALMVLSLDAVTKNRQLKAEQKIAVMEKYKKHYETVKDLPGIVSAN